MPKDFVKTKLKRGEYRMRNYNGILALNWKNKQDVYIISNKTRESRNDGSIQKSIQSYIETKMCY